MEDYLSMEPQTSAHDNINIEDTTIHGMDLAQIKHLARQIEWDMLNGIDTPAFHNFEDDATTQHIMQSTVMESSLSSYSHEDGSSDTTIEPMLFGSPDTSTPVSILESPTMTDYVLPVDLVATWDTHALDMMSPLLDFTFGTAPEWPLMDNSWLNEELASAAASGEVLQYQLPKAPTSFADTNQNAAASAAPISSASEPASADFTCSICSFTAASNTKLKTHINKHTLPFRCTAPRCTYAAAEKKSLQRHLLAQAKWDESHRVAAKRCGVKEVTYSCTGAGCEYVTIREDNLSRHVAKCPAVGRGMRKAK
ncbi:hypothetical protein N0V93_006065 [Gnomoniopsis smithogilvyi]|uniref:C2H2-type domain-containing protein n=1 Tax=Gnomoniopsis smithogilvyi TaxID=1191159 RepID=A0A9W8YNZ7_9PEZI|nr:hypothetical protein N0V93_006065 [Gnomoniopsis smithogilvyi]